MRRLRLIIPVLGSGPQSSAMAGPTPSSLSTYLKTLPPSETLSFSARRLVIPAMLIAARSLYALHILLPTHLLRRSLSQTIETYPSVEFPTYNLVNGVLLATNDGTLDAAALSVDVGRPVNFEIGSTNSNLTSCAFVCTHCLWIYRRPSLLCSAHSRLIPLISTLDQHLR